MDRKMKLLNKNIEYLIKGTGPHVLLLIPGTLGHPEIAFEAQLEGINPNDFTIATWDDRLRSTETTEDKLVQEFEEYADYSYEFMKALNIPKYSVLGTCGGGRSAMFLAAKYPHVVDKLILSSTNSFISDEEMAVYLDIQKPEKLTSLAPGLFHKYPQEVKKNWTKWVNHLEKIFNTKGGDICSHILKDIVCPTLILYGARDRLVKRSHVDYLKEHIKDSRAHIFPNGTHFVHSRHAEEYNKVVQDFLLETSRETSDKH